MIFEDLQFQPFQNSDSFFSLTGIYNDLEIQGNTTDLEVILTLDDYARLITDQTVATSIDTTFLSLPRGAIRSAFGDENVAISSSQALQANEYRPDTSPPYLRRFVVDLSTGEMKLRFSEPLAVDSFNASGIAFQSSSYQLIDATVPDEPVDNTAIRRRGVKYYQLLDDGVQLLYSEDYNRTLVVQLGDENMNNIKANVGLCVSKETCYLSVWKSFVSDFALNPIDVLTIDSLHAVPSFHHTPDLTPPELSYWDFNLNSGEVCLTFSETVYIDFFNFSAIILTNGGWDPSEGMSLNNGTNTGVLVSTDGNFSAVRVNEPVDRTDENSPRVCFTLNSVQFNALKALPTLLTRKLNSFIVLEPRIVVDTSLSQNEYLGLTEATYMDPMPIRTFIRDAIAPVLESFDLDLTTRTLTLHFSETIKLSSVNLEALRLQSERTATVSTESLQLSGDLVSIVSTRDSPTLVIYFMDEGFFLLKTLYSLAKSPGQTFLSLKRSFVLDRDEIIPNRVIQIFASFALKVSVYTPDLMAPALVLWEADFSTNKLRFLFSESVNASTIDPSAITLSSGTYPLFPSQSVTLQKEGTITANAAQNDFTIELTADQVNRILTATELCTSAENCLLAITELFVSDITTSTGDGALVHLPVLPVELLPPSSFVEEVVSPYLLSFSVNMNRREVSLVFSEPVQAIFINSSAISLSLNNESCQGPTAQCLRLSDTSYTRDIFGSILDLKLSQQDFIRVQQAFPLSTSVDTVFLEIANNAVQDQAGNWLNQTSLPGVALSRDEYNSFVGDSDVLMPASSFVRDSTGPVLVGVYLSPGVGSACGLGTNLTLFFSETLDLSAGATSLDQTAFLLSSSSGSTFALTNAVYLPTSTDANNRSSSISLCLAPIRSELVSRRLAQKQADTFVYIGKRGAVTDGSPAKNGNRAMTVQTSIRDGLSFTGFRLDMNTGLLLLEMTFYVPVRTVVPRLITMSSRDRGTSYTFQTSDGFEVLQDGPVLSLALRLRDYEAIRGNFILTSEDSVVLLMEAGAVVDVNGKVLSRRLLLECVQLVPDFNPLTISRFRLSLETGIITLFMSKEVDLSRVDLTEGAFILHSSRDNTSESMVLTGLDVNQTDGFISGSGLSKTVKLSLNNEEPLTTRENLLLRYPLGYSVNTCFLEVRRGAFYDVSVPSNPSQGYPKEQALEPEIIYQDLDAPELMYFDLDLNQRLLVLTFTEAVDSASGRPELITFLADPDVPTSTQYTLTSSSEVITLFPRREVEIRLSLFDVSQIVALIPSFLISPETTFLAHRSRMFYDLAEPPNPTPEVLFRYGMPVRTYTPDLTPPVLAAYNISIQTGALRLTFIEWVNCASFRVDLLLFQDREFVGANTQQQYRLTEASVVHCDADANLFPIIDITIGYEDLVRIKTFSRLLKTADHAYLRMLSGGVTDVAGNVAEEVLDGYALRAEVFTPDTKNPRLLSFLVSSQTRNLLTLYFDEPMDIQSLVLQEFMFQDNIPTFTRNFHLLGSELYRVDPLQMKFEIHLLNEFYRIAAGNSQIFERQDRSFLSVTSVAVRDTAGNHLTAISTSEAIQMGPTVIWWDLDVNTGRIDLVFSDEVNSSFSLVGVTVRSQSDQITSKSLALTTSATMQRVMVNGTEILTELYSILSDFDLNELKILGLADPPGDLFLSFVSNLTTSISDSNVLPNLISVRGRPSTAVEVRKLLADETPPVCHSFDLDLNSGLLVLNFDEPTVSTSLDLSQLTLFSDNNGTFLTLSNQNTVITLVNQTSLVVQLSASDLNALKSLIGSGPTLINSLLFGVNAVKDLAGNSIPQTDPDDPAPLGQFIPDTSPPRLLGWSLDRSNSLLVLVFDEFVPVQSLDPNMVYLQSDSNSSLAQFMVQLSNFTIVERDSSTTLFANTLNGIIEDLLAAYASVYADEDNVLVLNLGLLRQDGFALERAIASAYPRNTAVSNSSTFGNSEIDTLLRMSGFKDIFGNERSSEQVLSVFEVAPDTSALVVQAFDFESSGSTVAMSLYFSHIVFLDNFTCADFMLLSEASPAAAHTVLLTDTDCTVTSLTDDYYVTLNFPSTLISGTTIGDTTDSTWMNVPELGITTDFSNNRLLSINPSNALRVGPQLIGASLDLNTGEVLFVFSKAVDFSIPIDLSSFGFFSALSNQRYYLESTSNSSQLSPFVPDSNNTIGRLFLAPVDLINIKLLDVEINRFFVLVQPDSSLTDAAGVTLAPREFRRRLRVNRVVKDDQSPELLSFSMDLGLEQLILEFNEPIQTSSFEPKNLQLQAVRDLSSHSSPGSLFYTLVDSAVAERALNTLTLQLGPIDAQQIKLHPLIGKNSWNTFLSLTFGTARDIEGNYLPSISENGALQATSLLNDNVRPVLTGFDLDLSSPSGEAFLVFYFSEPVSIDPLSLLNVTVQTRFASREGIQYQLSGGTVVSAVGSVMTVRLLDDDVTAMKLISGLIRSRQSTYLVILSDFATDLAGNSVVPYLDGNALACTNYIADTTPPEVLVAIMNVNRGTIKFEMSEPIVLGTVDPTALTVQLSRVVTKASVDEFGNIINFYTLGEGTTVTQDTLLSLTVEINLSSEDQNQLKSRNPLISSLEFSYFSYLATLMTDFVGNTITAVRSSNALLAGRYQVDVTPPTLLKYALDLQSNVILLEFSETVLGTSVDMEQLVVQNIPTRRFGQFTALGDAGFSVGAAGDSVHLTVKLTEDTVTFMKFYGIGRDFNSSYLSWSDVFVSDPAGNFLLPYWDRSVFVTTEYSPRIPDTLIVDSTSPELDRWILDRDSKTLIGFFNEPVVLLNSSKLALFYMEDDNENTDYSVKISRSVTGENNYFPLSLSSLNPIYSDYNRVVKIPLQDFCKLSNSCSEVQGDPTEHFFSFLNQTESGFYFFLTVENGAFEDFAKIPNPILAISQTSALKEGITDCSVCDDGLYLFKNCTATEDRQCRVCSTCRNGTYMLASCSDHVDTSCAVCSTCGCDNYIAETCSATHDTVCQPCNRCTSMQYESRSCALGLNTICESCEVCDFQGNEEARTVCERGRNYRTWYQQNCCVDTRGRKVQCHQSDRQKMYETSINGNQDMFFDIIPTDETAKRTRPVEADLLRRLSLNGITGILKFHEVC